MEKIVVVDSQPIDKTEVIDRIKSKMIAAFKSIYRLKNDQKNIGFLRKKLIDGFGFDLEEDNSVSRTVNEINACKTVEDFKVFFLIYNTIIVSLRIENYNKNRKGEYPNSSLFMETAYELLVECQQLMVSDNLVKLISFDEAKKIKLAGFKPKASPKRRPKDKHVAQYNAELENQNNNLNAKNEKRVPAKKILEEKRKEMVKDMQEKIGKNEKPKKQEKHNSFPEAELKDINEILDIFLDGKRNGSEPYRNIIGQYTKSNSVVDFITLMYTTSYRKHFSMKIYNKLISYMKKYKIEISKVEEALWGEAYKKPAIKMENSNGKTGNINNKEKNQSGAKACCVAKPRSTYIITVTEIQDGATKKILRSFETEHISTIVNTISLDGRDHITEVELKALNCKPYGKDSI